MCLIAYCKTIKLTAAQIGAAWSGNSDGVGIIWAEAKAKDGPILNINKYFKLKEFAKFYATMPEGYPHAVHFRFATSGIRNADNTHPFRIDNTVAFMHNGVFTGLGNKDISDTHELCNQFKKLSPAFFRDEESLALVEKFCGSFNKLLFMFDDGTVKILNEKAGHWLDGNWYSNYGYERTPASYYNEGLDDWEDRMERESNRQVQRLLRGGKALTFPIRTELQKVHEAGHSYKTACHICGDVKWTTEYEEVQGFKNVEVCDDCAKTAIMDDCSFEEME
jgi:predicted glutamine amidotransferase